MAEFSAECGSQRGLPRGLGFLRYLLRKMTAVRVGGVFRGLVGIADCTGGNGVNGGRNPVLTMSLLADARPRLVAALYRSKRRSDSTPIHLRR